MIHVCLVDEPHPCGNKERGWCYSCPLRNPSPSEPGTLGWMLGLDNNVTVKQNRNIRKLQDRIKELESMIKEK